MRWKWQNRQKFNKDKRRPIPGRRCSAKNGLLGGSDITPAITVDKPMLRAGFVNGDGLVILAPPVLLAGLVDLLLLLLNFRNFVIQNEGHLRRRSVSIWFRRSFLLA